MGPPPNPYKRRPLTVARSPAAVRLPRLPYKMQCQNAYYQRSRSPNDEKKKADKARLANDDDKPTIVWPPNPKENPRYLRDYSSAGILLSREPAWPISNIPALESMLYKEMYIIYLLLLAHIGDQHHHRSPSSCCFSQSLLTLYRP